GRAEQRQAKAPGPLSCVLSGNDAFRADRNRMFGCLEVQIQQNAVVDFGLGEQNLPFVKLLLALFCGLAAGMLFRLLTRAVLPEFRLLTRAVLFLRVEANFRFSLFGS